ncbi:MAG: substrate-binding domain-containing protein [Acetobacteraceae bacterium]|nr:substrate-binding domain-containing protein [Acetobacteraceae bacterium]
MAAKDGHGGDLAREESFAKTARRAVSAHRHVPYPARMRRRLLLLLPLVARPCRAQSADGAAPVRVLSAGAMEPGLEAAIARFRATGGPPVQVAYATAPVLRERLAAGETPDLLIAPVGLVNELATAGRLTGERATLGRVGVGVAVREGAPVPEIGDTAAFRRAIEEAERVVFNRASTGLYLDRLFERLGMTAMVTPKAVRTATGAEVMRHLVAGSGREIGLAPVTEILMVPQVRFVGPLPAEIQNFTAYAAALLPNGPPGAAALFAHLAGPEARAAFATAGIEAVP